MNHKSELLEGVEAVCEFVGTLAGKVVVRSKEIADCVKNLATTKLEPKPASSTGSIKSPAKKKLAEMEKEKPTAKQSKLKEKTEKSKHSTASQSRPKPKAGVKTNFTVKTQKRQPPVTKTKKTNAESNVTTARN